MKKKLIFSLALTFSLTICGLNSLTAWADVNAPVANSESSENTHNIYDEGIVTELTPGNCVLEGDIGIPCPTACYDDDGAFQTCHYNKETGEYQILSPETVLEEGTSGEPEVVCADPTEPGCETGPSDEVTPNTPDEAEEEAETVEEPALWPMIISFVALGVTLVFIIVLNLFGRNRRK